MVEEEKKLTLSVERAGELLGISRATAYNLAKNGQLPVLRLGHRLVVPKVALQKMLENCHLPRNVN
ncbi:MAG: helix-turn-helix domain-containing protein [Chloroflexi bacterium]|nr:helix-turn-helix domain-containing protein [Chloroflexota bacterium]